MADYFKVGEPAKHVIRPGAGPMGMTLKSPDTETLLAYVVANGRFFRIALGEFGVPDIGLIYLIDSSLALPVLTGAATGFAAEGLSRLLLRARRLAARPTGSQ